MVSHERLDHFLLSAAKEIQTFTFCLAQILLLVKRPRSYASSRAIIIQVLMLYAVSQGLSDYVLQHVEGARTRGLVVGYDHRHHSEHWANVTASIFVAKGIKVYLLRGFNHTPL